jgi:hypothetical protein
VKEIRMQPDDVDVRTSTAAVKIEPTSASFVAGPPVCPADRVPMPLTAHSEIDNSLAALRGLLEKPARQRAKPAEPPP